jgi:hypothetical protein
MAFRYNEEDTKRLQKAINNYNRKVNRLTKSNHPYLPEKVSMTNIKANINNRWDYKRQIKYLEMFTTKGSERLITTEGGATLTKYEYQLLEQEQRRLYSKLTYKINKYGETKPRILGEEQDETYARMGDEMYENLKARRSNITKRKLHDINIKDLRILRNLVARTQEQYDRGDEGFYTRFIEYVLGGANLYFRLDHEKIQHIQDKLRNLSPNAFMDMYFTEQLFREILRIYNDKSKFPYAETRAEIKTIIDALDENIDTMVKDYE